ncbi:hypothetical protein B0O80DRAFT_163299 [Mortierella sp. GBAus27b]|nr:hypothetical protein BGX31_007048 [Mortierella sp. GBA43]KAI8361583.1 hypothetical protein B0O80DRAFT_163299 [Mortierella sp. GBAus27b]
MKATFLFSCMLFAALSILSPSEAHIAISNPLAQAGPWTKNPSNQVHAWIGFKGKKFPCGGYKMGPVTKYKAGDIVKVRFWNFQVRDIKKFPPRNGIPQARHGGGACEFSLSYDKGKTWKVIGQYTKSCPDIYYEWPVQIPKNVPSCTDPEKCLFSMSWVAFKTRQFYHHCANVIIDGKPGGKLPLLDMTVVDVKKRDTHAIGDKRTGKSSGPDPEEVKRNTNGFYAYGGGAGKKGIDLGLVRN